MLKYTLYCTFKFYNLIKFRNNNNLANINIANANNAAGNENMAMAGRRRRLQEIRAARNSSELGALGKP